MSREPSAATDVDGAAVLRDVYRELEAAEEQCGAAKSALVALRKRLDGDAGEAIERAFTEEPPLEETVEAIRTETLEALHRELSELVVRAPGAVPDEDLVDRLDDAADSLTDHHDRLRQATNRLAEMAAADAPAPAEAGEAVEEAIHRTNRIKLSMRRLRELLAEIAPEGTELTEGAFVVTGTVDHDGEPLAGLRVRAFDRDLTGFEPLGEATTDADGEYRIDYREADFAATEEGTVDLLVRVYDGLNRQLAETETRFDAGREEHLDVTVPEDRRNTPTEYARLRAEIEPLLGDQAVTDLSDGQVEFLRQEFEPADRDHYPADARVVERLRLAAQLATRTPFDERLLYGLVRERDTLELDEADLAESDPAELAERIDDAVEADIVSLATDGLEERLREGIEQLRRATDLETGDRARASVTLVGDDGSPLAGTNVRITDPDGDGGDQTLVTDAEGTVTFSFLRSSDGDRRFDLAALNEAGGELRSETVSVDDGTDAEVRVPERSGGFSGAATLSALSSDLDLPVSDELDDVTLGAVRRAGGVASLAPSLSPADRGAIDALASLDLLADPKTAGALVERGYRNQSAIAGTPLRSFQRELEASIEPEAAADLHAKAQAQSYVLDGAMLDRLGALRNGTGGGRDGE